MVPWHSRPLMLSLSPHTDLTHGSVQHSVAHSPPSIPSQPPLVVRGSYQNIWISKLALSPLVSQIGPWLVGLTLILWADKPLVSTPLARGPQSQAIVSCLSQPIRTLHIEHKTLPTAAASHWAWAVLTSTYKISGFTFLLLKQKFIGYFSFSS